MREHYGRIRAEAKHVALEGIAPLVFEVAVHQSVNQVAGSNSGDHPKLLNRLVDVRGWSGR
jgi:hypothetical protein